MHLSLPPSKSCARHVSQPAPARPTFMSQPINGSGRFKYSDGSEYDGEWKGGMQHGRGKSVFASGDTYEGDWIEGNMHGRGKMVFASGDTYEGDWSEDKKHGRGKFVCGVGPYMGDTYEGDYSEGESHGRGVTTFAVDGKTSKPGCDYSWNAGDSYDCGFKAGVRHGACTYTFFNGETFNCTWADGRCPEFTARQRAVQAAPDHACAQARAQAYADVQDRAAAEAAQH